MQAHQPIKANVAIILTDADRKILWVNDVFTTMTGYTLPEVIHKKPSLLQGANSNHQIVEEMRYCLEQGIAFKNEITNYRKSGAPYQCRLVVHPIRNAEGVITNFLAFEVDASIAADDSQHDVMNFSSKYQTSSLKGVKSLELYDRLRRAMKADQLHLDASLNLPQLAEMLDTNTKYLSQVVNHHYGNNLQQFVNEYRVNEAKLRLVNDEYANLTYFAIGQLCGFKNKSTFYKVFKKFTDCTPHEFVLQKKRAKTSPSTAISAGFQA